MIRILLSAILAVGLVAAQEPQSLSVSGLVISTTGDPVQRAQVLFRAKDEKAFSYTADTDANGRFAIQDIEPGDYLISADRQGFMRDDNGVEGAPSPTLKVQPGQSIRDLKIKLIPLAVLTGRVLDNDGDPVRGARVEVLAYGYQEGKKQLNGRHQISANDRGEFRLFDLRPGTVYLRASANNQPNFSTSDPSMPLPFTPTFFPSTTNAALARPIDLIPGAQLSGFDIRLRREKHFAVRGKVPALFQQEQSQTMLELQRRDGGWAEVGLSRTEDRFEFQNVEPGSYVIVGDVLSRGKRSAIRQPVEVGNADVENVVLNFVSPLSVSGSLRVEGAPPRPIGKAHIALYNNFGQTSTEVKPDGSFEFPEVAPDVYQVRIGYQSGAYVKSIRLGDADASVGEIDLTKESAPLTIVLATDTGEVEGSVKKSNGDPASRVPVTLIASGNHANRLDLSCYDFTDDQGKLHMKDVPPGEYKAFAWLDAPFGAAQDPDFRKSFEKRAVVVTVDPKGHASVDLTAISLKATQ